MKKKTIAVDIDDVLAEHIESFVEFSNKHHKTDLKLEDYLEHWAALWRVAHEEVVRRAQNFHTPDIVGNFPVVKDAKPVLMKLKQKYNLVIVTGRPKQTLPTTRTWIDKNFPAMFEEIHFVPIWEPNNTVTKAEICRNIGADFLIDDLIRHCNLATEAGVKSILFTRINWKQPEEIHPDVIQVRSWQEVLEYFDAAAG